MTVAKEPSNSEILVALQGMWGQQKDLILGVEKRLGAKIEAEVSASETRLRGEIGASETRLRGEITAVKEDLGERITREIMDRPVVVHVDMGRVSELEHEVAALKQRMAELEARLSS